MGLSCPRTSSMSQMRTMTPCHVNHIQQWYLRAQKLNYRWRVQREHLTSHIGVSGRERGTQTCLLEAKFLRNSCCWHLRRILHKALEHWGRRQTAREHVWEPILFQKNLVVGLAVVQEVCFIQNILKSKGLNCEPNPNFDTQTSCDKMSRNTWETCHNMKGAELSRERLGQG